MVSAALLLLPSLHPPSAPDARPQGSAAENASHTPPVATEVRAGEAVDPSAGPPQEASPDTTRFRLVEGPDGFALEERRGDSTRVIPVPREWLIPPEEAREWEGAYVSPFEYDETVTSFGVGDGGVGIRLSSYATQREGSAMAAVGRDVFLVLDPASGRLRRGGLELGVTKSRGRRMGCFRALSHEFLVADVDGDGLRDIGVVREEIRCEPDPSAGEPDLEPPLVPRYRKEPPRWYVYDDEAWSRKPDRRGRTPEGHVRLPTPGMTKTPVEFVREITRGR